LTSQVQWNQTPEGQAETKVPGPSSDQAPPRKARIAGVDIARGAALLGMMAVHIFPMLDDDGTPSLAWAVFAGRSAALFALLAGVGIALTTGGRRRPAPGERAAAAASVAVRAALLALIGLALGDISTDVDVILMAYSALFLLAVPLLGLGPIALTVATASIALLTPFLMQGVRDYLPEPSLTDPGFASLQDPAELVSSLLLTGVYPALPWMAYLCAGLAIGRLMRPSAQFASRLLCGGLLLAAVSWWSSSLLLNRFGGLDAIRASAPGMDEEAITDVLLWGPDPTLPTTTWWWLAIRAPHSTTPFDLLHTIGTSMVILGVALLLARVVPHALRPLAAAGAMTLTLYSAHVVVLATGLLADHPYLSYVVQGVAVLAFAVFWRDRFGPGPLEKAVTSPANRARDAVIASRRGTDRLVD
jgi:uncharacterized membrane protein